MVTGERITTAIMGILAAMATSTTIEGRTGTVIPIAVVQMVAIITIRIETVPTIIGIVMGANTMKKEESEMTIMSQTEAKCIEIRQFQFITAHVSFVFEQLRIFGSDYGGS